VGRRLDALMFGPARRSRQMRARLESLDQADARLRAAGLDPFDEWRREREPRRDVASVPTSKSRLRAKPVLLVVIVLALPLAAYFAGPGLKPAGHRASAGPRTPTRPATFPAVSREERSGPLGAPSPSPGGTGGFRFERTQVDGRTPVTWDPCRPIHYVLSGTPPAGQAGVIRSVVAELADLTGLRFVSDGPSNETATVARPDYQLARYGSRWAPVLVAWTDPAQLPKLAGPVIGLGGANAVRLGNGRATYVSGIVVLDRAQLDRVAHQPGGSAENGAGTRAVVLHEFGHLLGLAHVSDRASIMFPEAGLHVNDYSTGDRRGIHALSTGPCAPDL
jgi:hypothetical protein